MGDLIPCSVDVGSLSVEDAEDLRGVVGADALPFSTPILFKLDEIRFDTRSRINLVGLGGGDTSLRLSPVSTLSASGGRVDSGVVEGVAKSVAEGFG